MQETEQSDSITPGHSALYTKCPEIGFASAVAVLSRYHEGGWGQWPRREGHTQSHCLDVLDEYHGKKDETNMHSILG